MADITHYAEKLHEAALASPHSRICVTKQLRELLAKLEEPQGSHTLSPLETMPVHLLQMIVDEATVGSVARLFRTSSTMHERLLRTIKWMPPLIRYESRFFPNIVKYCYYRIVPNDYGNPTLFHDDLGYLEVNSLLRTPFRFETLEILPGKGSGIGAYGIQKDVVETKDLGLEYYYYYNANDEIMERDCLRMRKLAKEFVITLDETMDEESIEVYRYFLKRFKPKAVYFEYQKNVQITPELFPELLSVPFLDINQNLSKFSMDIILKTPQIEGGCLEKWHLEEILKHFITTVDLKIKKHVYMLKRGISLQDITDIFEQKGGGLKIGEHLPTWKCDKGQKRLLLVKKNRDVVITIVDF